MNIIIYVLLTMVVVMLASLSKKSNNKLIDTKGQQFEFIINEQRKLPQLSILIITILLSYFSAKIGSGGSFIDSQRYIYNFLVRYNDYYSSWETLFNASTEPGYLLLNMLIGKITDNPFWLFFFITFIFSYFNLSVLYKLTNRFVFAVLLFMISMYFFQSLYLLKQALAVTFGNIALYSLLNKKIRNYIIFSCLAISFHATAVILFPMFFLIKKNYSKRFYFILIASFVVFLVFFGQILSVILPKIPYVGSFLAVDEISLSQFEGTLASTLKGLPFYLISLLAIINRESLVKIHQHADFFILCSLIYSFSLISTYNLYWFFRVGWYFMLPTIAFIPNIFKITTNKVTKLLFLFIFIVPLVILTIRQMYIILY